jgi:hypothetical protein
MFDVVEDENRVSRLEAGDSAMAVGVFSLLNAF